MKNKVFKISVILVMILSMTMTNFIFVGNTLISYAADGIATNHKNVEFKAYFKEGEGREVTTIEKQPEEETFLYLRVNVKKEGYFNGEIALENSNFTLKESDSVYVNKIENNTIYLNQINVGTTEEIKVKIEPVKEENFTIGLLNMTSTMSIKGIYRDSTERDITIKANREVTLKLVENNTSENVQNEIKVISNKLIEVDGEKKRILQFSYLMGLKQNNYPMQEVYAKIVVPKMNGKQAQIEKVEYLNNMTNIDYQYDGTNLELNLENQTTNEGKVMWKTQGNDSVIVTCLYDEEAKIEDVPIHAYEKVKLYDGKEIEAENTITVGAEEIDNIFEVSAKNSEEMMYKGKLEVGLDRQYQSMTQVRVNYAKAIQTVELTEENSQYIVNDEQQEAKVIYNQTIIRKDQFDSLFGQNGTVVIYDQNGQVVDTITNATPMNQEGNIIINYEGKNVTKISIKTTAPVGEGTLELNHIKTIQAKGDIEKVKKASEIKNTILANGKSIETVISLQDSVTESKIELNKESLSTVVSNNVEIKAILVSNHEKYNLYQNPEITIQLPEQVENITINSMDLLYENEMKIKDYKVNGKTINVLLEGMQTQYKEETIEGAVIIINATIDLNRRAATSDEEIQMVVSNEEIAKTAKEIKIVAPTDITTIYSVQDLGVETLGQEENKQVLIQRGIQARQLEAQIEVINNKQETIENAKILGDFPTNNNRNNMGIEILQGITLEGNANTKIYYSENENATDEIEKAENGWTETIVDASKVSKYLITADHLETGSSIQGTYTYEIPANLEYNQTATTEYQVKYANSNTKVESELASTSIDMQTGIGPKVETKLMATVGGEEINRPVKNGEVITYKIEVANTGTEDVENITVKGKVPEGTTMVIPEENYEYTGASYYQEVDTKNYEAVKPILKVGEVAYAEYEVRVNNKVAEGTTLSNIAEIKYGDVTKQSNEIKNVTAKGNLRISVKRVTDRSVDLYTNGVVKYFAIIENISDQKQDNVKVQANLSENLEVTLLTLYTGMERVEGEVYSPSDSTELIEIKEETPKKQSNLQSQILEYAEEVNIGTLEAGETKVLSYNMLIHEAENDKNEINFSVTAKNEQEQYPSNEWKEEIEQVKVGISMTTNTQEQNIKAGDTIEYTIVVENKMETETTGVEIKDMIPKQLTIHQITQDGNAVDTIKSNNMIMPISIAGNEKTTIKIEAVVDYSEARDRAEAITNIAYVERYGETIATTSEISHIIEANDNGSQTTPPGGNDEDQNNDKKDENHIDDNDTAKGNKMITGVAWYDENANGQKEQGEKLLSNIKVRLLNTQTNHLVKEENGKVLEATTNENGIYVLDKIGNGKYIAIFDYDDSQYALTKYKVSGVSEAENSNAIISELVIENEKQEVASTDILEIQDNNISNINVGFIKLQNFDLKLDKYVNKILIQNAKGTTVREYNKATMAKVELDAKTINGSTIIIEYKIDVTNMGEIDGYAKKIADYATSDLKFSSELNKDWYQVGDILYTTSLANEKIKAGETKTVTLTLTKSMTENSTGLIPNTAEIAEDYNELGMKDSNSTPGNRVKGENDLGAAEVLLSIRTGGIIYVTAGIMITVLLGVIAVVIIKKRNHKEENK